MSNYVSTSGVPEQAPEALSVRCGPDECPSPHSFANKFARTAWGIVWLFLFRPTPKLLHKWRVFLLSIFGAKISRGVKVFPTVRVWAPWNLTIDEFATLSSGVDCYCVARVSIGSYATVSQESFLCTATHDVSDPNMRLLSLPITVEDQAWVCARAFVGPGVKVGRGAVVGAMAVVTKDVPSWTVVAGNPAREIGKRELRQSSEP
jgi:putative colanic acid biosynthesis acetyltransferase WcaF